MAGLQANLATSRRWLLEVFNQHDLDAVPDIISPAYTNYGTTDQVGVEAGRAVITQADEWAPDRRIEIVYEAASDDLVFILFAVSGTHTGPFAGIEPSNRPFCVHLADVFRFDDEGMMVEGWVIGKGDLQLALAAAGGTPEPI